MQKKIKYEKKIKLYKDIIEYNNNKKFIANYFNFSGIVPFLFV